jgi:hypothetical protein
MPWKGLSARRSESPVTMCVARPLTASSRNLSSLGSRQAAIRTSTSTHSASRVRAARKLRISSSSMYRRNFFATEDFIKFGERGKREKDSSFLECQVEGMTRLRIGQEQRTDQNVCVEDAAQLRALEERIQNLRRKPAVFGFATGVVEHFLQRGIFPSGQLSKPQAKQCLNLPLLLPPGGVVSPRRLRVQRNRDEGIRHLSYPSAILRQKLTILHSLLAGQSAARLFLLIGKPSKN